MNLRTDLPPIPFIDVAAQRRRLGQRSRCGGRPRSESLPVHSRAGGARLRGRARRLLRRQACGHLRQRHRRAGAGAAGEGHRAGRCGDLSVIHVLRDRGSGGAGRRHAGVRRCRRGHLQYRCERNCRRRRSRQKRGPHAEGGDSGRSVRPAGRPRRGRRRRQGGRPVHARRCRARLRRQLSTTAGSAPSATRPRPASFRPSRSAATATAAR